jgi:hypothetical protein
LRYFVGRLPGRTFGSVFPYRWVFGQRLRGPDQWCFRGLRRSTARGCRWRTSNPATDGLGNYMATELRHRSRRPRRHARHGGCANGEPVSIDHAAHGIMFNLPVGARRPSCSRATRRGASQILVSLCFTAGIHKSTPENAGSTGWHRRVGIPNCRFRDACSGFTRATAARRGAKTGEVAQGAATSALPRVRSNRTSSALFSSRDQA